MDKFDNLEKAIAEGREDEYRQKLKEEYESVYGIDPADIHTPRRSELNREQHLYIRGSKSWTNFSTEAYSRKFFFPKNEEQKSILAVQLGISEKLYRAILEEVDTNPYFIIMHAPLKDIQRTKFYEPK